MTTLAPALRRANLIGALWMIAAMAGFAAEDSFIKVAARMLPVGEILILFGLGGAAVFAAVAKAEGRSLLVPAVVSPPMLVRAVFEISGRLFYTLALALIPLSATTVILQATPLVVVACAALIFGEKVGWQRWTALILGLTGVVIIVQPGTEGFSVLSLLAVAGMLGFAGRDLASRIAPATLSTSALGFYGFLAVLVAGVVTGLWQGTPFVWPDGSTWLAMAGAIVAGAAAYSCLMKAMRTGDVSAVTPFRYTRLLFGLALGVLLFGEKLTSSMLIGSALIVLSGLFVLWRGRQAGAQR